MISEAKKQTIMQNANARARKHRQISRLIRAEDAAVETMAREYAETAIETLAAIMQDENSPSRDRIKAASELLDQGFGRSVERTIIASMPDGAGQDYSAMTTRELLLLASKYLVPPSAEETDVPQPSSGESGTDSGFKGGYRTD